MKKKSEKFSICTFCWCASCWESGMKLGYYQFKFLGLHLGREAFTNPFYTWLTFFQNIPSFTWRSYLNSTLFIIALQESLLVHFVCFEKVKTCEYSDKKRKIVLRVTRVRGFPILQESALKKKSLFLFFSFYNLVFLIRVIVYCENTRRA